MDIGGEGVIPPAPVGQNDGEQRSNLNISDVFEAISIADPSFGAAVEPEDSMYRAPPAPAPAPDQRPYVRIVEQPASKALRFRYECEGRSAGSIPGANSTPEKKTFPTIEICNHRGRAIVVVSCVTKDGKTEKDPRYMPHPHNLVGRELCKKGVCTVNVNPDSPIVTFSNLGIQCVKRRDIEEALRVREEMRVDPFKTGFSHKSHPQSIDLNAVRLCFQVFLPDERSGKVRHALPPVVSDVIYDKKAMCDLVITRLSHCSGPIEGGMTVILLCEKVAKEDIAVTFFSKSGGQVTWQADAVDVYVHKQVAICFTTPRYQDVHSPDPVQAYIQLRRPGDNTASEALPFELQPMTADPNYLKRKRQKPLSPEINRYLQPIDNELNVQMPDYFKYLGVPQEQKPIKLEPRADKTPPHLASPAHVFPSPHYSDQDQQHYQWNMQVDTMQGGLVVPGPSHMGPYSPHGQEMTWTNLGQVSPMHQAVSPMHQANMPPISPNLQAMSPNMQAMSPNMQAMSPNMQAMSPNMQAMSPNMQAMSPNMGHVSPNLAQMSPNLAQQTITQLPQNEMLPETGTESPTISGLLRDARYDGMPQLNSSELSGLSHLLNDERGLSDSLSRLSTGDLLRQVDQMN